MKKIDGVVGEVDDEQAALAWAKDAVERQKILFHVRLGTLGRASRCYPAGEFKGPNGRPLTCVVIEFSDGSSSVADPKAFAELTSEGEAFAEKVAEKLSATLRWLMIFSSQIGVDEEHALMILSAVFRGQTMRLQVSDVAAEGATAQPGALHATTGPLSAQRPTPPEGRQTGPDRGQAPIPAPAVESASTGQGAPLEALSEADWPPGFRKADLNPAEDAMDDFLGFGPKATK